MKKLPIALALTTLLFAGAGVASAHGPIFHHHPVAPVYHIHKTPTPAQVAYHKAHKDDDTIHLNVTIK